MPEWREGKIFTLCPSVLSDQLSCPFFMICGEPGMPAALGQGNRSLGLDVSPPSPGFFFHSYLPNGNFLFHTLAHGGVAGDGTFPVARGDGEHVAREKEGKGRACGVRRVCVLPAASPRHQPGSSPAQRCPPGASPDTPICKPRLATYCVCE